MDVDNTPSSVCSQSQNSQDQGVNEGPPDICLRCSKVIEHIPYKYKGHTFHAVCISCNFCGKKLIARPFLIEGSNIFCSDQCKVNFDGAAEVITEPLPAQPKENLIQQTSPSGEEEYSEGESLMEVLENIQEEGEEIMKRSTTLPKKSYDPDRLTDYPRAKSPEFSHSLSPVNEEYRSSSFSISTISESSLTSDGSSVISYDANRVPKKKILKHPHRARRHSKNRVKWNLPGGEDSDTSSLQSFDSTSTASEIYSRARAGVSDVRQNWREFETSPRRGSTGMTPMKPPRTYLHHGGGRNNFLSHSSSALFNSPSSSSNPGSLASHHSLPGGAHHIYKSRSVSTSSLPMNGKGISTVGNENQRSFSRSLSPLATSTETVPSIISPRRTFQSTPKSYHQSDTSLVLQTRRDMLEIATTKVQERSSDHHYDIDVPILKLNNSDVGELEESTMEDRRRMHIFQFPQNSPTYPTPPPVQTSSKLRKSVSAPVCKVRLDDDDDDDDYDHLGPLDNAEEEALLKKNREKKNEEKKNERDAINMLRNFSRKKVEKEKERNEEDDDMFSDQDIEDALEKIALESDTPSSPPLSPLKEKPPPLPAKIRTNVRNKDPELCSSWTEDSQSSPVSIEETTELVWTVCPPSLNEIEEKEIDHHTLVPNNQRHKEDTILEGCDMMIPSKTQLRVEVCHEREWRSNIATRVEEKTDVSPRMKEVAGTSEKMVDISLRTEKGVSTSPKTVERDGHFRDERKNETTKDSIAPPNGATNSSKPGSNCRQPPPVPPKTKHIKRVNRDTNGNPVLVQNHSEQHHLSPPMEDLLIEEEGVDINLPPPITAANSCNVEDILPPPPQFAFASLKFNPPPPPQFSPPPPMAFAENSEEVTQHREWTTTPEESLASVSNSTLIPDTEEQSEARQISETDRENSLSPPPLPPPVTSRTSNKHSWSAIHHKKVRNKDQPIASNGNSSHNDSSPSHEIPSSHGNSLPENMVTEQHHYQRTSATHDQDDKTNTEIDDSVFNNSKPKESAIRERSHSSGGGGGGGSGGGDPGLDNSKNPTRERAERSGSAGYGDSGLDIIKSRENTTKERSKSSGDNDGTEGGNNSAPIHRYKMSMELALTEDNLLKHHHNHHHHHHHHHRHNHPVPPHKKPQRNHTKEKGPNSDDQLVKRVPHHLAPLPPPPPSSSSQPSLEEHQILHPSNGKPHRLAPLPPPPPSSSSQPSLEEHQILHPSNGKPHHLSPLPPPPPSSFSPPSLEEHQILHPTNGKPHTRKLINHDAERHIQEMLAEIDSEGRRLNPSHHGMCGKCSKAIWSKKELCLFDGLCYHTKCYQCTTCSIALQGRKVFRVRTMLLCRECYDNNNIKYDTKSHASSSNSAGNNHRMHKILKYPQHDLVGSSSSSVGGGGQVTTV